MGRRFRALKLWFMLRSEGVDALQARLRRDLDNAQWLAGQVGAKAEWEVLAPVQLQTLCIRHRPAGLEGEALDAHTKGWAERLNASGDAYVTPATLDGRWMVRVSVGALPTERGMSSGSGRACRKWLKADNAGAAMRPRRSISGSLPESCLYG